LAAILRQGFEARARVKQVRAAKAAAKRKASAYLDSLASEQIDRTRVPRRQTQHSKLAKDSKPKPKPAYQQPPQHQLRQQLHHQTPIRKTRNGNPCETGRRQPRHKGWEVDIADAFVRDGRVVCVMKWQDTIDLRDSLRSDVLRAKCDRILAKKYGEDVLQQYQTTYGRGCPRVRRRPQRYKK
jgi:hypothetical protein